MNKPNNITDNDWQLLKTKYNEDELHRVIEQIESNYPVQYLIGNVDFYGYEIIVKEGVLIPRFETEGLIEKTINYLNEYNLCDATTLEVGTGSGAIPVVLKNKLPQLKITTIDKSEQALSIAKENINKYNLDIEVLNEDLFKYKPNKKYSLLISNPPYIRYDLEIDPKCKYEPDMALYADHDGLIFYEYILDNAHSWMNDKFIMAFEIGEEQGKYLLDYAKKNYPNSLVTVEKDLSERDRYLFVINE